MRQTRYSPLLTIAAVIVLVALLQTTASAHHKPDHEGGPSPSPTSSPSPTVSPTPTSSPAPGNSPASPCAVLEPLTASKQLSCTAVSEDGVLDIRGALEATPHVYTDCSSWLNMWPCLYPGASFYVGIETADGVQLICDGSYNSVGVDACQASVNVPPGTAVRCWMNVLVDPWQQAVAELSCS